MSMGSFCGMNKRDVLLQRTLSDASSAPTVSDLFRWMLIPNVKYVALSGRRTGAEINILKESLSADDIICESAGTTTLLALVGNNRLGWCVFNTLFPTIMWKEVRAVPHQKDDERHKKQHFARSDNRANTAPCIRRAETITSFRGGCGNSHSLQNNHHGSLLIRLLEIPRPQSSKPTLFTPIFL
ncbi:hypothetical protein J6590_054584 [Homalodisca vitripennis]|nr:hypothetical protein J6590_054584 [Homalodisca vitripennis]